MKLQLRSSLPSCLTGNGENKRNTRVKLRPELEIRVAVETSEDRRIRDKTGWSFIPAAFHMQSFVSYPTYFKILHLSSVSHHFKCSQFFLCYNEFYVIYVHFWQISNITLTATDVIGYPTKFLIISGNENIFMMISKIS